MPGAPDRGRKGGSVTLRLLVFGVMTLVTMIPLFLFWAWPHSRALQDEMDAVSDRNLQIALALAQSLGRYERDVRSLFSLVATNLIDGRAVDGGGEALATLRLRELCIAEPESGQVVAGLIGDDGRCPTALEAPERARLLDLASAPGARFGALVADWQGRPALSIALSRGGVLAFGHLATDDFVALAEAVAFGDHGHAAIVDRAGRLLAHPNAAWRLERRDLSPLPPVQAMLRGESGTDVFLSPATGEDMVVGYAAVPGTGWGVMVPQPLAELHADAQAVQASALGVVAIGAFAACLVSWLLSGLLIGPLRAVAQAARAMADGARSPEVKRLGRLAPSELKDLRTSFNDMAEAVEASRKEQEDARRMAEEAYLTRSRFLAHMSHEIRTPLNAVIGFSEVMLERTYGPIGVPKYEEYLRDIHESANHLLSLINDLLDLSRVDVDDLPFEDAPVALDQVMALSSALIQPRAREKAISIVVAPEEPDLRVRGDQRLLRRILLHLLSNAVSFTPDGGWVVMRARRLAGGGLELRVEDNGEGMSAAACAQALSLPREPVARDPWSPPGAGRGLHIVTKLVERHGGSFTLESEPGLGTTAIVTLPAERTLREDTRRSAAPQGDRLVATGR